MTGNGRCGRPTKNGHPCQKLPVHAGPGACYHHLTTEERAAWQEQQAQFDAAMAMIEASSTKTPACWEWPVPTVEELRDRYVDELVTAEYSIAGLPGLPSPTRDQA